MKTLEIRVISESDEAFVKEVLDALARRRIIEWAEALPGREGNPYTPDEYEQLIEQAETGTPLSAAQAKAYLGL